MSPEPRVPTPWEFQRTREPREPRERTNHWVDYGGVGRFVCDRHPEFCDNCGRQLMEHIVMDGRHSATTGLPTYVRYHSCPTWVEGWRTKRWARGWALPGYGHESHDADNPMSGRGYR